MWEEPHLHGDVGDGGGRQVKVLLHQDVELGGQVAAGPNTVHLAGQQGGHLLGEDRGRRGHTPTECLWSFLQ